MKFSSEKKSSIRMYILEKIEQGTEGLSRYVAESLGISTNTVHSYLGELQEEGIIRKSRRGCYELTENRYEYLLKRSRGELEHDTYAYEEYLYPLISHLPENIEHIWSYGISEMVNNVIDHSGAESLVLSISQNYLSTRVILADNGVGIFKKIKEHFSLASLDEAICELFKGKLTTDAENHSGEGIFFTSKMMDTFLIVSDGKIFAVDKYDADAVADIDMNPGGTCVYMSLSNFANRNAAEVFNRYSNEDGGFSKTRILLKNIFDKAPISRSQAKRV
ncbi:MAG: winged helix-turn-helix transcriptional regulator, partial [Clostridia bacterium]|nr:winged helix-turn-helix transcriptional regulator [Clostridia bacterium]